MIMESGSTIDSITFLAVAESINLNLFSCYTAKLMLKTQISKIHMVPTAVKQILQTSGRQHIQTKNIQLQKLYSQLFATSLKFKQQAILKLPQQEAHIVSALPLTGVWNMQLHFAHLVYAFLHWSWSEVVCFLLSLWVRENLTLPNKKTSRRG